MHCKKAVCIKLYVHWQKMTKKTNIQEWKVELFSANATRDDENLVIIRIIKSSVHNFENNTVPEAKKRRPLHTFSNPNTNRSGFSNQTRSSGWAFSPGYRLIGQRTPSAQLQDTGSWLSPRSSGTFAHQPQSTGITFFCFLFSAVGLFACLCRAWSRKGCTQCAPYGTVKVCIILRDKVKSKWLLIFNIG